MYNLGRASANIRTLLPSFSFVESHLPPQGGLKKQGGLRNQIVLFTFWEFYGIIIWGSYLLDKLEFDEEFNCMKNKLHVICSVLLLVAVLISFTGCFEHDTTEAKNGLYSNTKGDLFCIVHDDTITVCRKNDANAVTASSIVSQTYTFILENNYYKGENEENIISFKFNGDDLNLKLDDKTYSLSLDRGVSFNDILR